MVEENNTQDEYTFQVGSFGFSSFAELYDNINGRAGAKKKLQCSIVKEGKAVMSFPVTYENNLATRKHRFVFEWETMQRAAFNQNPDMSSQLKSKLPKFQLVGSMLKAGVGGQAKLYGFLDIASLK